MVGVFRAEEVAGGDPGAQAAISPVLGEAFVVAYGPARLIGDEVGTEGRPRRHAHDAVEGDVVFHHHVHHSGGE